MTDERPPWEIARERHRNAERAPGRTPGDNPGDEFQDGFRLRRYPTSDSRGFIHGEQVLCDACAHEHHHGQPSKHWARPSDNCESTRHESNALLASSGAKEPNEYEQYRNHPEVLGWLGDEFTRKEHTLCPSCAEDKYSAGADMDNYTPMHQRFVVPDDTCRDCGHVLSSGRKEASVRRRAISDAEFQALTDLPPLDLDRGETGKCSRCGATLAPGEEGLCPNCQNDGGTRKHRQRQMLVRTQGGVEKVAMQHARMMQVLDRIWSQGARFDQWDPQNHRYIPAQEVAGRKYDSYRGRSGYVPIANSTWAHKDTDGNLHIRHHNTDIVSFSPEGHVTINTDGWHSMTTKQRVNAFLPDNMKWMRNPSRREGASEMVVAHNPNGGSIYPDYNDPSTRGKYGLHRDTVLHDYEDGFSINPHTGERLPDDHVRPGTMAAPPRARGFSPDNPAPGSAPRRQRDYYGIPSYSPSGEWHGGPMPSGRPGVSPVVHPYRPEPREPGEGYDREHDRRQLEYADQRPAGIDAYDSSASWSPSQAGDDLPQEGESFDDWMKRTAPTPKTRDCPTCKGKGDVRKPGPLPVGVKPWEHRQDCPDCNGKGFLPLTRSDLDRTSSRVAYSRHDLAHFEEFYLRGLRRLAYGETRAPQQVNTLRDDTCPVCGDADSYDGDQCQVCGFVTPPKMFQDPDLERARLIDLRANPATGEPNNTDPNIGDPNAPVVDPNQVNTEGDIVGLEAGTNYDNGAEVNGDVRTLDTGVPGMNPRPGEVVDATDPNAVVDPTQVDPEGNVVVDPLNGIQDPAAATPRVNQGGEPFTKGPNAPQPLNPMTPGTQLVDDEDEAGEGNVAADGQVLGDDDAGAPGQPGDATPDLVCPSCGFQAPAASPTSTPENAQAPASEPDGMLEGDVCPNCGQAALMGVGQVEQAQQAAAQGAPVV